MSDRYEDFNALAEMLGVRAKIDIRGDVRDVVDAVIDAVNFLMADSLANKPIMIPQEQFDRTESRAA